MRQLTFESLTFEITRRCNMNCQHCMKGDAQDIDLQLEHIDGALDQTQMIYRLCIGGGEPSLNVEGLKHLIDGLYQRKIPVFEFEITTNGLEYNDEFANQIIRIGELIQISRECFFPNEERPFYKKVFFKVSIDKFHAERDRVKQNIEKFKSALNEKATVCELHLGDFTVYTGKARKNNLKNCYKQPFDKDNIIQRIELLDENHKPRCPQYRTFKLLFEGQAIVCCDLVITSKGRLMRGNYYTVEYEIADMEDLEICMADDDIYESLLQYNVGRIDCLSNLGKKAEYYLETPLSFSDFRNYFMMQKKRKYLNPEEMIEEIPGAYDLNDIVKMAMENSEIIDTMIEQAESRDYEDY